MYENFKDWKAFVAEIDKQTQLLLDDDDCSALDVQSTTLVPTLIQMTKSLAIIADELDEICQCMEKK